MKLELGTELKRNLGKPIDFSKVDEIYPVDYEIGDNERHGGSLVILGNGNLQMTEEQALCLALDKPFYTKINDNNIVTFDVETEPFDVNSSHHKAYDEFARMSYAYLDFLVIIELDDNGGTVIYAHEDINNRRVNQKVIGEYEDIQDAKLKVDPVKYAKKAVEPIIDKMSKDEKQQALIMLQKELNK